MNNHDAIYYTNRILHFTRHRTFQMNFSLYIITYVRDLSVT